MFRAKDDPTPYSLFLCFNALGDVERWGNVLRVFT
jgi:hypothetical protein